VRSASLLREDATPTLTPKRTSRQNLWPTIFMLDKKLYFKFISLVNTYRLIQKKVCRPHSNAHKPPKPVAPTIFMLEKNVN